MAFSPKSCQYLLFDLDGTLTDSREGILRCIEHALMACGRPKPERQTLYPFVGPPLYESFHDLMGMDETQTAFAIQKYRERFSTVGMFENAVYEGIPALLGQLKEKGYTLAVATSKPEVYTLQILTHFQLDAYFDVIAGSDIQNDTETKADVIRKACKRLGLPTENPAGTVMIGDRKHDLIGAHACGISCIGVAYGYAPPGELEVYQADVIVESVAALGEIF